MIEAIISLATAGNGLLLALLAGVVAAVTAWLRGRISGAKAERNEQASKRLDSIVTSKEIDDAIAGRDANANRDALKKWSR